MWITIHGRWPKLENSLKILIVEYITNHWLDLAQIFILGLYDQTKDYKNIYWRWPPWNTSLIGRQPQNSDCVISQQPLIASFSNFKLKLMWPNQIEEKNKMKMTVHERRNKIGRQPQNIDSGISPQSLIGSCSNVKLELMWPNQRLQKHKLRMATHGTRPYLDDNLKIVIVEYLINHRLHPA
jgi:hypothetical protein